MSDFIIIGGLASQLGVTLWTLRKMSQWVEKADKSAIRTLFLFSLVNNQEQERVILLAKEADHER